MPVTRKTLVLGTLCILVFVSVILSRHGGEKEELTNYVADGGVSGGLNKNEPKPKVAHPSPLNKATSRPTTLPSDVSSQSTTVQKVLRRTKPIKPKDKIGGGSNSKITPSPVSSTTSPTTRRTTTLSTVSSTSQSSVSSKQNSESQSKSQKAGLTTKPFTKSPETSLPSSSTSLSTNSSSTRSLNTSSTTRFSSSTSRPLSSFGDMSTETFVTEIVTEMLETYPSNSTSV